VEFINQERSLDILLYNFGTHGHFVGAFKQLSETAETIDANSSRCKARLAYPNVLTPIYLAVLLVLTLQLFVHLVGLVHDIEIGDLPSSELEHISHQLLLIKFIGHLAFQRRW
jgi:hypothetical protein